MIVATVETAQRETLNHLENAMTLFLLLFIMDERFYVAISPLQTRIIYFISPLHRVEPQRFRIHNVFTVHQQIFGD